MSFRVIDMEPELVLGIPFLRRFDPIINWKRKTLRFFHRGCLVRLQSSCSPVTPVLQPQPVRSNVGQEIRPKAKGFQLSLERYNWIAQVEEKCALQNISNEEIGKWAKVHLEGNALAYISRLGISDWEEIKMYLQKQFVPKHNNQLLRTQLLKLRQQGDIQIYIHDFQAILNRIEDEMADGDQLFFFLNGLTNDCRRYVELHHPSKL